MNSILLTSGTGLQAGAMQRAASAPCAPPRRSVTAGDSSVREAKVKPDVQQLPAANYRKWETAGSGVETALFVSVQAVMLVCIVLVAAQLFATV